MKRLYSSLLIAATLTVAPFVNAADNQVAVFPVCYEISNNVPGAPVLRLDLLVNAPNSTITGYAKVSQAIQAPPVESKLRGEYVVHTLFPNVSQIKFVIATGYPNINWPSGLRRDIVIFPNLELNMVLHNGWQSGTASYSYTHDGLPTNDSKWIYVTDIPAKSVPCFK
ncbi:DUF1842 domain-containing protein [Candidatus Albibeggiatoa sp. nov. BB20]|uniref:DUF1842 domain-containing protein n=1 Tax=Candidatus Albibeggiatoa sp. nov. BB20 TaxID=3162723 RepID=UPI0033658547